MQYTLVIFNTYIQLLRYFLLRHFVLAKSSYRLVRVNIFSSFFLSFLLPLCFHSLNAGLFTL